MITEKLCPQTKRERGEVRVKRRDVCIVFVFYLWQRESIAYIMTRADGFSLVYSVVVFNSHNGRQH